MRARVILALALTLTGAVQAQEATVWTVDGKKVFLTPKTVVTGTIAVGDRVVIVGIGTPEGALLAESSAGRNHEIRVQR